MAERKPTAIRPSGKPAPSLMARHAASAAAAAAGGVGVVKAAVPKLGRPMAVSQRAANLTMVEAAGGQAEASSGDDDGAED